MNNSVIVGIENQLNKLFDSLDHKWIKVSFILSKLDLSLITTQINRKEKIFTTDSLIKLYLYQRIKAITRYPELLKTLREDPKDAYELGFNKDDDNYLILPQKRTYNDFLHNKINKELKNKLELIAHEILKTAVKNKIILDLKLVKETINKEQKTKEKKKAIKEATKLVKKLVYPQIDIKIKENGKFTTKDLLDVLVHVAQTKDFANNGTATFKELNSEVKCPSSWTMLYHFNKFNKNQIQNMFDKIFDVIFNFSKKNYNLLNKRKLDIAIDIHKIHYYGDKNDPYVMEGKHDRGTTHFYQFITCAIVVAGRRFTLDAILMHNLDNLEELVDKLIKRAKSKINIDKVYLDRGFDSINVINTLKNNRVKFVMPKVRTATVKAWMDKSRACKARVIEDFEIGRKNKATCNLILVDSKEGVKLSFINNFHIPVQLTHYLYLWYSKRWGIETSYSKLDNDFKAKTTSKNYLIRLFYFLFSVCLYNLWVLVNICVSIALYGRIKDKPVITAKLFAVILYRISIEDPPT